MAQSGDEAVCNKNNLCWLFSKYLYS